MLSHTAILSLFIVPLIPVVLTAQSIGNGSVLSGSREKRILDSIFETGYYDSRIRPRGEKHYTLVNVSAHIRSGSIDDYYMEFQCQMTFRKSWNDKRLAYDDADHSVKFITLSDADKIWMPDLIFDNAKQVDPSEIEDSKPLIRIYPNGDVVHSTRLSVLLHCPMHLKNFPFDRPICSISISPNGLTTDDIFLLWSEEYAISVRNLRVPRFAFSRFLINDFSKSVEGEEYSFLTVLLQLDREFDYYMSHIYIPFIMLTLISWISFWLDPKALTVRILIEITALIVMAMQTYRINYSLPTASYANALDEWIVVCLAFVCCTLLEIVTVNYISRMADRRRHDDDKLEDVELNKMGDGSENIELKLSSPDHENNTQDNLRENRGKFSESLNKCPGFTSFMTWFDQHFPSSSEKIDGISRICFPLAFAIFNLCYWVTYLSESFVMTDF